jgi:hypothetical protein
MKGINLLDAPVLAPEEQDVYSLQRDTARALQRSAMDANDGEHFAPGRATVVECFRVINISLLRSKDRCVKYILTLISIPLLEEAGSINSAEGSNLPTTARPQQPKICCVLITGF